MQGKCVQRCVQQLGWWRGAVRGVGNAKDYFAMGRGVRDAAARKRAKTSAVALAQASHPRALARRVSRSRRELGIVQIQEAFPLLQPTSFHVRRGEQRRSQLNLHAFAIGPLAQT